MKKGFTLIELLVVISIISLGASIVFAATRTARDKAQDAKIKQSLVQIRTKAGLLYSGGCYHSGSGECPTVAGVTNLICPISTISNSSDASFQSLFNNPEIQVLVAGAKIASGGSTWGYCRHSSKGQNWAMIVISRTDNHKAWCVDSTGVLKQTDDGDGYSGTSDLVNDIPSVACGS